MKVLSPCDTNDSVWISEAIQLRLVVSLTPQKGFFLLFRVLSGIGIERTFHHSFRVSLTRTARVNSAECVNKLTIKTLISIPYRRWSMQSSMSVVFMDLFIWHHRSDSSPGSACKPQAQCTTRRLHQKVPSHRVYLRHARTETLSNAAVVTVFSSSFSAKFSIKVCLLGKNKSHRV